MNTYLRKAKELLSGFEETEIRQIMREENCHAYALTNLGSVVRTEDHRTIMLVYLKWPAIWKIDEQEISELSYQVTWMTPLINYIANIIFLDDKDESRKIKIKADRFTIIEEQIFRRSFSGPYLTCITGDQIPIILAKLHKMQKSFRRTKSSP